MSATISASWGEERPGAAPASELSREAPIKRAFFQLGVVKGRQGCPGLE